MIRFDSNPFNYSTEFASGIALPFSLQSKIGGLIIQPESEKEDYLEDRANWISKTGAEYSPGDMEGLWEMILCQKMRVQAFWLVAQGRFMAYNPARESLS